MGVSTDGILFYGWLFDEGHEFPWTECRDGDEEEWWMKANGYEPPFQLFDEHGEYLDGREPSAAERREYWDHWHK